MVNRLHQLLVKRSARVVKPALIRPVGFICTLISCYANTAQCAKSAMGTKASNKLMQISQTDRNDNPQPKNTSYCPVTSHHNKFLMDLN